MCHSFFIIWSILEPRADILQNKEEEIENLKLLFKQIWQNSGISDDKLTNKTAVEETKSTANETVSEAVEKRPDSACYNPVTSKSASLIKLKYKYSEGMFIARICSL